LISDGFGGEQMLGEPERAAVGDFGRSRLHSVHSPYFIGKRYEGFIEIQDLLWITDLKQQRSSRARTVPRGFNGLLRSASGLKLLRCLAVRIVAEKMTSG
jgi:hypothetical protein